MRLDRASFCDEMKCPLEVDKEEYLVNHNQDLHSLTVVLPDEDRYSLDDLTQRASLSLHKDQGPCWRPLGEMLKAVPYVRAVLRKNERKCQPQRDEVLVVPLLRAFLHKKHGKCQPQREEVL